MVMHLQSFVLNVLATIAFASLGASASTSSQEIEPVKQGSVHRHPKVTLDDIGEKNKSQKLADGPGAKKEGHFTNTLNASQSVKRKKELGVHAFNPFTNRIKTPLPGGLHAVIKSFGACSSSKATDCHVPARKKDKGKSNLPSSST